MAFEQALSTRSVIAGADLSTKQFYAVKLNSSGQIVLSGSGEFVYGILQDKPASGAVGAVAVHGVTLAIYGASVTAGTRLMSDGAGKLIHATSSNQVVAIARESGANNEIRTVEILRAGALP